MLIKILSLKKKGISMDGNADKHSQKLMGSLEEILSLYRQLLDSVRKERDYLISADREKLEENNQLKESLLLKLKLADALRLRAATDLAFHLKAESNPPRLLDLAQRVPELLGQKMRSLHSALDLIIQRIVEINKENEAYAEAALNSLHGSLGELKGVISGKPTYEKKGQYKLGPHVAGNFVSKEA